MKNHSSKAGSPVCKLCNIVLKTSDRDVVTITTAFGHILTFHLYDLSIRETTIPKGIAKSEQMTIKRMNKRLKLRHLKVTQVMGQPLELPLETFQIMNDLFEQLQKCTNSPDGELMKKKLSGKFLALIYLGYFPQHKRNKKKSGSSSVGVAANY